MIHKSLRFLVLKTCCCCEIIAQRPACCRACFLRTQASNSQKSYIERVFTGVFAACKLRNQAFPLVGIVGYQFLSLCNLLIPSTAWVPVLLQLFRPLVSSVAHFSRTEAQNELVPLLHVQKASGQGQGPCVLLQRQAASKQHSNLVQMQLT